MFFDDHNPPHFHAEYGGDLALIDIRTLAVFSGRLPPRVTGLVIEWATRHQQELLADWIGHGRERSSRKSRRWNEGWLTIGLRKTRGTRLLPKMLGANAMSRKSHFYERNQMSQHNYDVAFSYAAEQRQYVHETYECLKGWEFRYLTMRRRLPRYGEKPLRVFK
jgi:Domain of unknown function (DUF4160)